MKERMTHFALDIRQVDFSNFDKDIWKCPKNNGPPPTSYRDVILVTKKHGTAVECITAGWYPRNGYKEGDFYKNNRIIELDNVYLWRDLSFIKSGEYVK